MPIPYRAYELLWSNTEKNDKKRIASQTPVGGVGEISDLPYIDDNAREHLCDLYFPENKSGKLPVIIDIHGGGWLYGYKEINKYYNYYLASCGYNVVSLNYTLCPKATIDGQIREIFSAFSYIYSVAEKYDFDMNNVYLTGDSAGAELAAIATSLFSRSDLCELYGVELPKFTFNAVGFTCGAFDIKFLTALPLTKRYAEALLGKDFKHSKYAKFTNLSDILEAKTEFPPIWMLSSKEDIFGFCSNKFDRVLTEKGIFHKYRWYDKSKKLRSGVSASCNSTVDGAKVVVHSSTGRSLPHVFNVTNPEFEESVEANNDMLAFFEMYKK